MCSSRGETGLLGLPRTSAAACEALSGTASCPREGLPSRRDTPTAPGAEMWVLDRRFVKCHWWRVARFHLAENLMALSISPLLSCN